MLSAACVLKAPPTAAPSKNANASVLHRFRSTIRLWTLAEDLLQCPHFFAFLKKHPHGFFEILDGLFFGVTAGGNAESRACAPRTCVPL